DLLADIKHRRLVPLAFADHHGAVDGEAVERGAHGIDRGLVRRLLVAAPHEPRGGQSRRLGHAHHFQRQVAIHCRCLLHFHESCSIDITCGGSRTAETWLSLLTTREICAWLVSWVVKTTGTRSPGARARCIMDSSETFSSRMMAATSAMT